jgi:hypothetical protein
MEHAHKRPNYILIWVFLAVLTAVELSVAFALAEDESSLLLFFAVWKALRWGCSCTSVREMELCGCGHHRSLALILLFAGMSEHIW